MNNHPEDIRYVRGKVYKSEQDGAITDETGEKEHYWMDKFLFNLYFIQVYNKRRRHENSRTG
jgi:hypothetical protein